MIALTRQTQIDKNNRYSAGVSVTGVSCQEKAEPQAGIRRITTGPAGSGASAHPVKNCIPCTPKTCERPAGVDAGPVRERCACSVPHLVEDSPGGQQTPRVIENERQCPLLIELG